MRLCTLTDGRTAAVLRGGLEVLPGSLVDYLCRPAPTLGAPEPLPYDEARIGPPIARPGKIVGVGLNYADHAREGGKDLPERPLLFAKLSTCVIGPGADILTPRGDVLLDYEAELAVVIGRPARRVDAGSAHEYIGGYACFNDVSERNAQNSDGQWLRAKGADTFGPFGPWVVTPDEVSEPQALGIRCWVNGELRQDSSTAEMVIPVPELVSYCSHSFSLEPGDVIATGTPAGVGMGSGRYLVPGDEVTIAIDGLGTLVNRVAAPPAA